MRRLTPIVALALFLAVPVWAQHGGGGHGGGGGHAGGFGGGHAGGGFSSGHVGGFAGGHMGGFSGAHPGGFSGHGGRAFTPSASARGFSHGFSHQPFLHNGVGIHIRTRGFSKSCWGFPCRTWGWGWGWGSPWAWGWSPWWWSNDSSSFDDDYNQNLAIAAEMNRQNLEQLRMLRQEQADGDQDAYANRYNDPPRKYQSDRNAQGSDPAPEKKGSPLFSNTVLVFRDKHEEEVENYAIVGDVLWNFVPGRTQRISLDDLDLAATEKANEDRGMTFRLPDGS